MIDTHKAIKEMVGAGASEELAEVIAKQFNRADEELVTKSFLAQELKILRSDFQKEIAQLRQEMAELKTELTRSMRLHVGMGVAFLSLLMTLFEFIG